MILFSVTAITMEFQSTHPSGVRPAIIESQRPEVFNFNPRTPVGCDASLISRLSRQKHFNPRTPVGCDTFASACLGLFHVFQSTHPSGVRRTVESSLQWDAVISIHAPQWGATTQNPELYSPSELFQSTHPSGVRLSILVVAAVDCGISIHAPQWGATRLPNIDNELDLDFNPRTPVGCDAPCRATVPAPSNFNPRTPVGCDSENGHSIP